MGHKVQQPDLPDNQRSRQTENRAGRAANSRQQPDTGDGAAAEPVHDGGCESRQAAGWGQQVNSQQNR